MENQETVINSIMQKIFNNLLYAALVMLLPYCTSTPKVGSDATSLPVYYTEEDFTKLRKFDSHVHLNTVEPAYIHQAIDDNFRFLDIVDDRPFGITMDDQEKIALEQRRAFPQQILYATTFPVKNFNEENFQSETIARLAKAITSGAVAVKVWKNIGMAHKDADSNFVMIDHPRFDKIINYLESNHIPIIGHLGEPRECWLPLDQMVLHKGYYSQHPEYHMYLHPEYPSYEKQIEAKDNMLIKHPNLKFIGAHLGSLEWSLDELAKRLDRFPNMSVDLARMQDLFLHAKNDWEKTREFFVKYQDRLLYATDVQVNPTADTAALKKRMHDIRLRDWRFLATDKKMNESSIGQFKGLHLPAAVINKIYYGNAAALFPSIDKLKH